MVDRSGFSGPKTNKKDRSGFKGSSSTGSMKAEGANALSTDWPKWATEVPKGPRSRTGFGAVKRKEAPPSPFSSASASPSPKAKPKAAPASKKAPMTGWEAKVKPARKSFDESRGELGNFYLNATSGMFSDKAGGTKGKKGKK